ncbi:hypothetical protein [Iodobacter sp.]|uniref:hypothetical protein n=1 Tax=Iodobacter sp. TaxID=1915058 RepID=UPI00260079F1|nr:hypothetical protein [Iodobacter sp.]
MTGGKAARGSEKRAFYYGDFGESASTLVISDELLAFTGVAAVGCLHQVFIAGGKKFKELIMFH